VEGYNGAVRASARIVLRDGEAVTVCESVRGDEPLLREFLEGLDLDARRLSFFDGGADTLGALRAPAAGAGRRVSMIALDREGRVVGQAVSVESAPGRTEVAVEVAERLLGQGLRMMLLGRLAEVAETRRTAVLGI